MTYNPRIPLRAVLTMKLMPLFGQDCKWLFLHLRIPTSSSRYEFTILINFPASPLCALATNLRNGAMHSWQGT